MRKTLLMSALMLTLAACQSSEAPQQAAAPAPAPGMPSKDGPRDASC